MATEVKLPRLGQGMESGVVLKWLKNEGEKVEKGDLLYELETEKVTQEVEAEASGVLLKITVREGEADVGATLALIGEEGEEVSAPKSSNGGAPTAVEEQEGDDPAEQSAEKPAEAPARAPERERGCAASAGDGAAPQETPPSTRADGRIKASPLARRIA